MPIVPAMWMPVLTGRTSLEVEEALESEVVRAAGLNASDEVFAELGLQHPLGVGFTGAQDILPHDWDEQTALSHIKGVTPALMRQMALVGTPDEVLEQAAEWRDCGVRYLVVVNATFMQRSLRNAIGALRPFARIMRGLKKL